MVCLRKKNFDVSYTWYKSLLQTEITLGPVQSLSGCCNSAMKSEQEKNAKCWTFPWTTVAQWSLFYVSLSELAQTSIVCHLSLKGGIGILIWIWDVTNQESSHRVSVVRGLSQETLMFRPKSWHFLGSKALFQVHLRITYLV